MNTNEQKKQSQPSPASGHKPGRVMQVTWAVVDVEFAPG